MTRPVGRVILGLMIVSVVVYLLLLWFHPFALVTNPIAMAAGLLFVVLPFCVWYEIQGAILVTANDRVPFHEGRAL